MTIEQAITDFIAHTKVGKRTDNTARTYAMVLARFGEYLQDSEIPLTHPTTDLTADLAIRFVHWLQGRYREKSPSDEEMPKSSLRIYLAGMSRFYAWLSKEQLIALPAAELERLKAHYRDFRKGSYSRLPKLPEEGAVDRIIAAARNIAPSNDERKELVRLRNIALLEVLKSTGVRVEELVGMDCDRLRPRDRSTTVLGKEDKERYVFFDGRAWQAIQVYLAARRRSSLGSPDRQPLFVQHSVRAGKKALRISTRTVERVFARCLKLSGVEQHLTPHSLRHEFATRLLDATDNLAVVQDALGHASPNTTRIYTQVDPTRIRDAHREAFDD